MKKREVFSYAVPAADTEVLITEWHSGEGFDVVLMDESTISLHMDEIAAIVKVAVKETFVECS